MIKITFDNGEVYTEEQFKKDYVRMMDSLRDDDYPKGSIDCSGVSCYKCPIKNCCDNDDYNSVFKVFKIVHDWAKEHQIVTNRDKLKEVFGINVINSIVVDCEKKESFKAYSFSNIKDKRIVLNPISQYDEAFGDWLDEEYKETEKND